MSTCCTLRREDDSVGYNDRDLASRLAGALQKEKRADGSPISVFAPDGEAWEVRLKHGLEVRPLPHRTQPPSQKMFHPSIHLIDASSTILFYPCLCLAAPSPQSRDIYAPDMLASAWQPSGNIILLVSEGGLRTIRHADRGEDVTLLEYEYSLAQKLKGKKRVMLLLVKDKSGANFSSFSTEVFPGGEVAKVSPTRSTLTNLSIELSLPLSLSLSLSLHTYICASMHTHTSCIYLWI